ncbi:hypothetical protein MS3_00008110 [Schistosoma haematobium]|uniref:C2 domain-containing protein n=1 Tax=Schistosoma haematobium TaxID=6185 RepID=A0A922IP97_SCHHA|nr:hypothetical protein MS3_00008110 [Schistosoma haematobium]KAH9583827.1 hypothetical protein MS3_00008110 [Schistosoma haematobium]
MYALHVNVKKANNLKNIEISGKSDPYVVVDFQGQKQKTKVIDDDLNPIWNEVDNNYSTKLNIQSNSFLYQIGNNNRFKRKAFSCFRQRIDQSNGFRQSYTRQIHGTSVDSVTLCFVNNS